MAAPLPLDAKEQVRQAIDIVELVGGYLPLRRQGNRFVATCPWHDDAHPSLQVNPERQSFKCWVCDIGGDVFSFVMRMENIDFRQALEMLAERAGIRLKGLANKRAAGGLDPSDKNVLLAAAAWAEEKFHRLLLTAPEAQPARDYLDQRGINQQSVEGFRLGFAPDRWDWLVTEARSTEWTVPVLERVGLLRRNQSRNSHYDWFRGRLMFPIRDQRGRPIAFGGRVLPQLADTKAAKYINSPETPLFSKSNQLYALDRARGAIGQEQSIVVVEGYTDCIMAHQHGVGNVVAVLGTALGERHLALLKRYTDAITLVLDGDEAGQRRANEILELFVANQVDLRILALPENVDPCEFIHLHGGDAFRQRLTQAADALQHKIDVETKGLVLSRDTHRAAEAVERILISLASTRPARSAATSPGLIREQQVLSRLAREFRLPEQQLRTRLTDLRRSARRSRRPQAEPSVPPMVKASELPAWDREMLELLLHDPHQLPVITAAIGADAFQSDVCRTLYDACCRVFRGDELPTFERMLLETEDVQQKALLIQLEETNRAKLPRDATSQVADLIAHVERAQQDQQHVERIRALEEGQFDQRQEKEVLGKIFHELKSRQVPSDPTDG